ncbi:DUF2254 domain-containing protein [Clavibacter zhangzhiyongii]|uniref:DUF2254 domain-containing protein n=1 Tax=Clavibacter zhangzhiyongii TaxID=2768071 RepID=UPI00195968C2|nr:DUF2254 domain-containing protein [Clavibacter zhangzhiyongii]MBM7026598.1 DUF2254 domain-containing protein [Clavibacter zhangzhiyongii]
MRSRLLHARESFWLLPALLGLGAVLLALGLVEVDRLLIAAGIDDIPLVEDLSATGGRAILSAIGGTMLGVAATSFSITISVLATTSSAYGPRLVRNFMADRGNQVVLAVLTSTFLYALIVLRSIHTEEDGVVGFVPVLAVSAAVLLAVADVAVLVYFIHHIAMSVQVTTLQTRVLADLERVIDETRPEREADADGAPWRGDATSVGPALDGPVRVVRATSTGYVAGIDLAALVAEARRRGARHRVVALPGTHVVDGDPLVEVVGGDLDADEAVARLAFDLQPARTPHQDIDYAVQQMVEIGVRGLASGTNDPYTAVGALDALSGALRTLCLRPTPEVDVHRDGDGVPRVEIRWPRPAALVSEAFLAIRAYGVGHALVMRATLRLAARLEAVADDEVRATLHREVRALAASYERTDPEPVDADPLRERLAGLEERLAGARG